MAFAVTNTFTGGTAADADEVNANFTDIENQFNDSTPTYNTLPHICPIGSVAAWLKNLGTTHTPALPTGWEECNGQVLSDADSVYDGDTLPDLNANAGTERFLRGAATSGAEGGAETHTHTVTPPVNSNQGGTTNTGWRNGAKTSSAGSSLPSYHSVVWIMRVK